MTVNSHIQQVLKNLPKQPGVYRYYGLDGSLLYVGKAKNLKDRVSSYFQKSGLLNPRIALMTSQVQRIEYTVVHSETESLLLEASLINSLQPKYNIKLKDNPNYCYIRLSNDDIPGFFVTRQKHDTQGVYFGPYSNKLVAEEILRTVRTIFSFCQSKKPQKRPCWHVGLGQCDGVCCGQEDLATYLQKIEQIKQILSGRIQPVKAFITDQIRLAVAKENYALANLWKKRLHLLDKTLQSSKVVLPTPQDLDLISLVIDQEPTGLQLGSLFVQQIREGKIINVNNFLLTGSELIATNQSEKTHQTSLAQKFLSRFLSSYYATSNQKVPILIEVFANSAI